MAGDIASGAVSAEDIKKAAIDKAKYQGKKVTDKVQAEAEKELKKSINGAMDQL